LSVIDDKNIYIINSARKHGISDEDIQYAIVHSLCGILLREEPEKRMFFGFDFKGRALEVGAELQDDGRWKIIHAMKLRKEYQKYLCSWKELDHHE
jgi:hypothetical protein